jgi:hypothetical protein
MIKAIQELKTENDLLKEKLAEFEKKQVILAVEIEKMKTAQVKDVKLGSN